MSKIQAVIAERLSNLRNNALRAISDQWCSLFKHDNTAQRCFRMTLLMDWASYLPALADALNGKEENGGRLTPNDIQDSWRGHQDYNRYFPKNVRDR